jgi:hypothetical protein
MREKPSCFCGSEGGWSDGFTRYPASFMTVTAPVNADANAYVVQWSLEDTPFKGSYTLVGILEAQPVASVMGILRD